MDLKRYLTPAVALFFLSPLIAELLSGSTPPLEFINPILLALNLALYGSGAILIRELAFRWKKGWPSILALGIAYGLIEEGLALKSVYNPAYPGVDASFGRWMGVNWVWTLGMVVFHAVVSISIPIVLVTLIFPDKKEKPWAGDRTLVVLAAIMALAVILLNFIIAPYSPDILLYVLTIVAIIFLAIAARLFPLKLKPYEIKSPGRRWFFLFGFFWLVFFYLTIFIPSYLKPAFPAVMLVMLAFYAISALSIMRMTGNGGSWDDRQKLALISGILAPFIVGTPLRELLGARGTIIVGIAAVLFLLWVNKRISTKV